jgi:hypothetical protein
MYKNGRYVRADMAHSLVNQQISQPMIIFFLHFPIYLQSVYIHSNTVSKLRVEKRGRVEECSVAPLRDKRVKTLCGCQGKMIQTKEKYKLRLNN